MTQSQMKGGHSASLLWLGGFKFLWFIWCHSSGGADHMDLCSVAPARVTDQEIKIRKQDVDSTHRRVPRSPQGYEAFAWDNINLQKQRDDFCVPVLTTC